MDYHRKFIVKPRHRVDLGKIDPGFAQAGIDKAAARRILAKNVSRLAELQFLLFAENKHALLAVFQATDGGGKDGAIRHIMSGLNPQSCRVKAFKTPSIEELQHDFLWRIHKETPGRGEIGVFNRSHYEDVLIARVKNLVPKSVWSKRYKQINHFESILADNNIHILKFFLYISKDEQKKRFEKRLKDPTRYWKFTPSDAADRKLWDDYIRAYEDAMTECSTAHAPWFIIPSNHKWFRNLAISSIMIHTLESLHMRFPKAQFDPENIKL